MEINSRIIIVIDFQTPLKMYHFFMTKAFRNIKVVILAERMILPDISISDISMKTTEKAIPIHSLGLKIPKVCSKKRIS